MSKFKVTRKFQRLRHRLRSMHNLVTDNSHARYQISTYNVPVCLENHHRYWTAGQRVSRDEL